MRVTVADRIAAHLMESPGSQAKEIAEALDISHAHASNTLRRMTKNGLVTSKPSSEQCQTFKRRYYVVGNEGRALAVAAQGQAYSSPFGVVMAQLIR